MADRWWIIGSAAVSLHGRDVGPIKDVDLLMWAADADRFLRRVGVEPRPGQPTVAFRSEVFGTWNGPPIPVEVMGGFSVHDKDRWREVALSTRAAVELRGRTIFVPSRDELVGLLQSFGRPKDLDSARLLRG